jgi:PleD family two-component response regulator
MRDSERGARRPTVLIGSHQESSSSSLESILVPGGYWVIKAYTGAQVVERAGSAQPDVIILDSVLPDRDGLSVCRELRRDPLLANTPIIIISPDHVTRQERIEALRAGAWDHLGAPLDAEHLLLKVETFARTKLEADRAREEGLLDQGTGLYNLRGLARRAQELASQASRQSAGFACVVFAPAFEDGASGAEPSNGAIEEAVEQVATAFRAAGRQSDAIGRVGPTEFAVVAFGTDAAGSVKLAERLRDAVYGGAAKRFRLRAGYYVVADSRARPADAAATVLRAAAALRQSHRDPAGSWIRAFPEDPEVISTIA